MKSMRPRQTRIGFNTDIFMNILRNVTGFSLFSFTLKISYNGFKLAFDFFHSHGGSCSCIDYVILILTSCRSSLTSSGGRPYNHASASVAFVLSSCSTRYRGDSGTYDTRAKRISGIIPQAIAWARQGKKSPITSLFMTMDTTILGSH